ncbi:uncharacterized protein C2845_PM07G13680 [Panicum miliaceum]|uniref:F-box domain-containing protein n=1 Tax=Panicum miliaceum TaxID=4540 RepID=A0A3L6SI85_PANMI|nr:uncharacterized protein C2845_PM07G13680 [Panicum miliaceum]
MGMLALSRLMPVKRRRRTQTAYCTEDGSTASAARRKSTPTNRPCRSSAGAIAKRRSHLTLDRLPQDLLHQIFALLPMQDAARAGCASRQLLWSWRHYPELEFSARTLQLDGHHACVRDQVAKDIIRRIDAALQNRTGICVKRLRFELQFLRKVRAGTTNRWLDAAAALGIEELTLDLPLGDGKLRYRFPCELFSDGKGRCSIQSLRLSACSFSPGHGSCSFGSLRRVGFSCVRITTEESCLFLSNCPALERLELEYCHEIARLRKTSTLQLLVSLRVRHCKMLRAVETDAPKLSISVEDAPLQMRLGDIDPSKLPTHCHQQFMLVMDTGFRPDLAELFYYILNYVASLRCLTLDYRIQGFEKVLVAHIAQDIGTVVIKSCGRIFVTSKDSSTLHEEA